jgi:predicted dehydrogenase
MSDPKIPSSQPEPENQKATPSRRAVMQAAGAAAVGAVALDQLTKAPAVVHAAPDQVQFGVVGVGGRGSYLLKHLNNVDNGRAVAICDLRDEALTKGVDTYKLGKPQTFKDYRELLNQKNVEAVIIAVPLFLHFEVTKAALEAGKHVFCEKSLVFRPEEVHELRALAAKYNKQVLQVGLQRRYSKFYQTARQMIEKGMLGNVTHVHAQWHRNPGWTMKPGGKENGANWRLFKQYSGGLTAELASHQIDVADWMFGASPEYVIGVGGLDTWKDGRDIFDNIQLIYKYPKGQKLVYSSITTNQHLPFLNATRPEFGECIMGTQGALHLTIGDGESTLPTGMWFVEPKKTQAATAEKGKEKAAAAGASYAMGAGMKGLPILTDKDEVTDKDSFWSKELKYARRWLYNKGVMVAEEDRNPVDVSLESFFKDCKTGGKPKADLELGLHDSVAVMLSNIAMEQERRVYFNEIESMGKKGAAPAAPAKKG